MGWGLRCPWQDLLGVAVDPTTGDVLIETADHKSQVIAEFTTMGEYLGKIAGIPAKDRFETDALSVTGARGAG